MASTKRTGTVIENTTALVSSIAPAHGLNFGHGYTKVVVITEDGTELEPVVFPSQIARAGGEVAGGARIADRVLAGGEEWWVGEDAELADNQITMHTQQRLSDPYFIPALTSAAYRMLAPAPTPSPVAVTGLPATWAANTEMAKQLGAAIRKGSPMTYEKIRVIPEPVALICSLLYDNDGQEVGDERLLGTVGVADAGQITLDLAVVRKKVPIESRLSTSSRLGIAQAVKQVRGKLSAWFEKDVSLFQTDQAIRTGSLKVAGQNRPLPSGWDAPIIEHGTAMASYMGEEWRAGTDLDTIAFGGGGAEMEIIVDRVQKRFPHLQVVDRPQIAIALGYARFARRIASQMR